ncbi:sigma-54-dependent transcriptional regulator [Pseudoalteromonas denitrificans]|uniref:DNA-binding transcriptional response regulator, NtrC family, contains REC, AAA-type ATPase, and a Fis-type DNA-binding domains n=1 Tax=Pseudoalteromonas denitrificans DSM 6059 TaxID=1123010 RepID=A0A1I1G3T9_9GAMM|nr:sigma-54 dependent transcriptional regulator [Pseudoalteromonas denitrificans]SFC05946.1 DNA-binding transcriptional response regulator, NtrC family, contains REC, AAA-type ATPase, and a Fis-type DNA-binding domains [Pseudoalteromonas denitrificans DSM 6059]
MKRILVVDDNPDILDALDLLLSLYHFDVLTVSTVKEAIMAVSHQNIDLVIQDMNFSEGTTSGEEGKNLFHSIRAINPNLAVIIITAWSQLETAIELVKAGATDYLPKPWNDEKLLDAINANLAKENPITSAPSSFIFKSAQMQHLVQMAQKIAGSDINVLITGPNGSGKEKLADYIHQCSSRCHNAFIKVNMGALPHDLMEAELFGAEKGAFTGANAERIGRFEAADEGTLFLDEIGNLSLSGQMKLLRVLQTGEFERLGSSKTLKVNVRVISATNSNLIQAIGEQTFREDLYYRLNIVELKLAPLINRKEDIIPLAAHFIGHDNSLSQSAKTYLLNQKWSGNVRELENSCKRALVFASDACITESDFHPLSHNRDNKMHFAQTEKDKILHTLNKYNWVISRAANELGFSRQALYRRIEKYELKQDI